MRICLVRCPAPFLIDDRAFPPLGLLAVGTGLRLCGHEVLVYDGPLDAIPLDYDGYGFGPTDPESPYALLARETIRRHRPYARMVLGGPRATLYPDDCVHEAWDCLVMGDGEFAAESAFIGSNSLVVGEELPLDAYPISDRTLVDLRSYRYRLDGRPGTTLVTARGCPYHCGFCSKNHARVRFRSAEKVVEEVTILHETFGYDALVFPEDIFILHKERAESICRELRSRGIIWRCLVRADTALRHGSEFVRLMAESGCREVGMGIESGSDQILATIQKGETVSTIREAIRLLQSHKIRVKGFFILGLPGETAETLAETDKFLAESALDDVDVKIFQPYPGSPIWNHRKAYDIRWQEVQPEHTFYKGRPGEYHGTVSTSSLTTGQIVQAWKTMEEKYKRWPIYP